MLKVRKSYEDIFNDIEGEESEVYVAWPSNSDSHLSVLNYPRFLSKKEKQNESKLVKLEQKKEEKKTNAFIKNSIEFQKGGQNLTDIDLNSEQIKFLDIENLKQMSKTDLISLRESISLEMLWIQQAIQSRLQVSFYLNRFLLFFN